MLLTNLRSTVPHVETRIGWLQRSYYRELLEWVYKEIEPCIIIEEFIGGSGDVPRDYKFFVFDGSVELIEVDAQRFTEHRRALYTPQWEKIGARLLMRPSLAMCLVRNILTRCS